MTYFDPFQAKEIGIICETKRYAWKSINRAFLQNSINGLFEKIECVPVSEEFTKKLNFSKVPVNMGLFLIWSHDSFDEAQFNEYLKEIKVPQNHINKSRIHILHNVDILKLYSIKQSIEKIKRELKVNEGEKFDIYFPSYQSNDSYKNNSLIILEYFKSDYIFGKMIKFETRSDGSRYPNSITVIFYFGKLDLESLDYLSSALRRFQLTDEKIKIYHYLDSSPYRSPITEFTRKHPKTNFSFERMDTYTEIPEGELS